MRPLPRAAALLPALLGLLLAIALAPVLASPAQAATIVLSGKVIGLNASGTTVAIQDAFVEIDDSHGNPLSPRAYDYTAADGTYQITVPAAGTYRIGIECWGTYPCAQEWAPDPYVTKTIDASLVVNATLERWGRITGTVKKDGVATPWPDGVITAWNDPRSYWTSPEVKADGSGRFVIEKVAPGVVGVAGREPGGGEQFLSTVDGQSVTVAPGQTSNIDLAVEDWPGLYVRAVDAADNSTPLSGLRWNVYSRPVGTSTWDAGLQMGPLRTNDLGRMSHRITDKTREYTVCFYDDADESSATVRRLTRCLGNTPDLATAKTWRHTAAQPKLKADIALPYAFTTTPVPTITGEPKVGSTLTAQAGTWSPSATLSDQWLRAGAAIAGATKSTYVPVAEDLGKSLTVRVTGSRAGYVTTPRTSDAVVVGEGTFTAPVPTISGSMTVGSTLTAHTGVWVPTATTLDYQWLRSGVAIPGATAQTYQVTAQVAGTTLSVRVTGGRAGYATTSVVSASAGTAAEASFTAAPAPKVKGKPRVGSKLRAVVGAWSPQPATTTYQWFRNGKRIKGATKAKYKVKKADKGKRITVVVTQALPGYATVARTSAKTKRVR